MMDNKLVIPIYLCELLEPISHTHRMYYKLPEGMSIRGQNVICEISSKKFNRYKYLLGQESEGAFVEDKGRIKFLSSFGLDMLYNCIVLELDRQYRCNPKINYKIQQNSYVNT